MRTRSCSLLLILVAVGAPLRAVATPDVPQLQTFTRPQYPARATENVNVATDAGDVFARITRPNVPDGVQVPVVLTYSPYASLGTAGIGTAFVRRGYAQVVADVIGTGNSGGCWDYGGRREQASVRALIEWLGTQSWSNGKVALYGASYDGTTANMAAVLDPPSEHLATIIPHVAISDWYSYAYGDGVRYFLMDPGQRQGTIVDEQGFDTPASFDLAYGLVPPADRTVIAADPQRMAMHAIERPCAGMTDKLDHTRRAYELDPDYDEFWDERGYIHQASKVRVPVLVVGGWRDYNVKHSESSRWYDAIPLDDPSTPLADGAPFKMLVMGQGAHAEADDPLFPTILHAWLDQFLYGYDTNITEQLPSRSRANDGALRVDGSWPPPATQEVPLYLRGSGALTTASPAGDEGSSVVVDGGRMTESEALRLRAEGSAEVAWFVTDPLAADLRIAGTPLLDAFASTDLPSTQFTPVLFDLGPPVSQAPSLCTFQPAAEACVIARGFLNARHVDGLRHGKDLTPGAPYRARVRFIDNDWVVKAGHRIGVAVMSSNAWWALPDQLRATTTIAHDATRPSALLLPIVGGTDAATSAGL